MDHPAKPLHERLVFDTLRGEVRDGPRRYAILRADVLMGLFDQLDPQARQQALQAFGASVARFGGESVEAYLAQCGPDALLQVMKQSSASLGWGCWHIEQTPDTLLLEVENSPFAASTQVRGAPACHPIAGMLAAVAQALWGGQATARELHCACEEDATDTAGRCVFKAFRGATASKA